MCVCLIACVITCPDPSVLSAEGGGGGGGAGRAIISRGGGGKKENGGEEKNEAEEQSRSVQSRVTLRYILIKEKSGSF